MNQLILQEHEKISPTLVHIKAGNRLNHIREILRAEKGDLLKVALLNQGKGIARLTAMEADFCQLEIVEFQNLPKNTWCHLLVGLSRPPTLKKILEHGACMGVESFHFFETQLSEKSYAQSKLLQPGEYEKVLHLGLAQSSRYFRLPHVQTYPRFSSFQREFLQETPENNKFVLSPTATQTFAHYPLNRHEENFYLAIGGERGWSEKEYQVFLDNGFQPVRISASVLRVEMSVFYSLAQLELLSRLQT